MQRWWYVRAREGLTRIRRPGGAGHITRAPVWIDHMASPDFYRKVRRTGDIEVLVEADERPGQSDPVKEPKLTAAQRKKQARIDLENVGEAIGKARADTKRLSEIKPTDKEHAAIVAAELAAIEFRASVLEKTKAQLETELGASPSPDGNQED